MSAELETKDETDTDEEFEVLIFTPFNENGEVIIEEIWNMTMNDELVVFGFLRQFQYMLSAQYVVPSLISYCCLAFYAEGNALDRKLSNYYDYNPMEDLLYYGKFSRTFKCQKLGILQDDDELNELEIDNTDSKLHEFDKNKNENEQTNIAVIKKLYKSQMDIDDIESIRKEIRFLKQIRILKTRCVDDSKYITELIDLFEDKHHSYIITNYCNKGNLWQHIRNKYSDLAEDEFGNDCYDGVSNKKMMNQILKGISFLHKHNILHLSLCPLFILLHQDVNNETYVQITKFFDAKYMDDDDKAIKVSDFMDPEFIAPEVINGSYDKKSDIWSIGIMFFLIHFGYTPFYETFGVWFPENIECDKNLKDLISNMLQTDLSKRFSINECLQHQYFT